MKRRIIVITLVVLLLFAGCAPAEEPAQTPQEELDFGTNPENISTGVGLFAEDNGFIYVSWLVGDDYILEYDVGEDRGVAIYLPKGTEEIPPPSATSIQSPMIGRSSVFLVRQYVGFVGEVREQFQYTDDTGKMKWGLRHKKNLNLIDLVSGEHIEISELGNHVQRVIPVKKQYSAEELEAMESASQKDNPLAGVELYFYFGYDTFPEKKAELEIDGITLKEPVDENERNQYVVPSIGRMDGDTREVEILTMDTNGWFHVDDQYVYYIKTDPSDNRIMLYRSKRDEIAFEYMDLGKIGNCLASYDGGFYFYRLPDKQICYYKDGEITELPIFGSAFQRWRDQIIFYSNQNVEGVKYYPMKSYDLNTGEIKLLCEDCTWFLSIVGDKYLGCVNYSTGDDVLYLVDLETGDKIKLPMLED